VKKKEEVRHPTVYFSIIVSSSVDPKKIINRCAHEWTRNGETRMNIKELQDICTETVVSMFRISTATPKECILGELKMILTKAQSLAQEEDPTKFDLSIYPEEGENETLPAFNLQIQNVKLQGQDVSLFNKLRKRAHYARKSWHVKVAKKLLKT
jgi:hypothetical protein